MLKKLLFLIGLLCVNDLVLFNFLGGFNYLTNNKGENKKNTGVINLANLNIQKAGYGNINDDISTSISGDILGCVGLQSFCKDNKLYNEAIVSHDKGLCFKIKNRDIRKACYNYFAVSALGLSGCRGDMNCIDYYYYLHGDCNKITDTHLKYICKNSY